MNSQPVSEATNDEPTLLLKLGWGAMVLGMFMAVLDIMIVSSSLNEIQASLSISPEDVDWVQTAYLIAEVIMIPFTAWFSHRLTSRNAFLWSVAGFTLMSIACAMATSFESLVLFRLLQGFAGGAMVPISFSVTFSIFPPHRQRLPTVIIGLAMTMAPAIGPVLGGWVTEHLSWTWLFLINVLPGILVFILVWLMPVFEPADDQNRPLDSIGLLLMAVFLGSLVYSLHEGPHEDWFDDQTVLLMSVISIVSGIGFLLRLLTCRYPIVDLSVFRDRYFTIGTSLAFVHGIGIFGVSYIAALFLGRVAGLNAFQIGSIMIVAGAAQFVMSPIAGFLTKFIRPVWLLLAGFLLFSFALYSNSFQTSDSRFSAFLLPQLLWGGAIMLIFLPMNMMTFSQLSPDKMKNASAVHNLVRNLGGAVGLALINTVLHIRENYHRNGLINHVEITNDAFLERQTQFIEFLRGRASYFSDGATAEQLYLKLTDQLVIQQSQVLAFNDVSFYLALLLLSSTSLIPFFWFDGAGKKSKSKSHTLAH